MNTQPSSPEGAVDLTLLDHYFPIIVEGESVPGLAADNYFKLENKSFNKILNRL